MAEFLIHLFKQRLQLTCIIDSKLKLTPFHNVNSPLAAPVTSRRPSGTH